MNLLEIKCCQLKCIRSLIMKHCVYGTFLLLHFVSFIMGYRKQGFDQIKITFYLKKSWITHNEAVFCLLWSLLSIYVK